jgi:hypothetical protein
MRRRAALLTLLIGLAFILAGAVADISLLSAGTSGARVAAADDHSGASEPLRPMNKGAQGQQDQQSGAKQTGKTGGKSGQRHGRAKDIRQFCTGPGRVPLKRIDGCTHGPDPAPPGFRINRPVPPLRENVAAADAGGIACDGDGTTGDRVEVLYVHATDVRSRYETYLPSIRAWAADADQIFAQSAAETGAGRNLRFVHDAACQISVDEVTISPDGGGDFWKMVDELQQQGFNRTDRIYLSFVDARVYCGIGSVWGDDRPDPSLNRNNIGPSYSRVDSGCWGGYTAAHELMHNLGGVQLSAPHTSGGFHCIDEYDVMCYSDWPNYPQMEHVCPDPALDRTELDCNHDDYFNTNPPAGSYLATHWNAANSRFLIGSPAPPPDPTPPPSAGHHHKHKHHRHHHHKHHR